MELLKKLKQCKSNTKGAFFIFCFRISSFFSKNKLLKLVGFPIRLLYKIIINWILGIDIPDSTRIGKNFQVFHGQGLIISNKTLIGNNVVARHNTTIGNAKSGGACPIIGDNVNIGANSVIIGEIFIGNNSIIAAGSVVIKDVPANVIVAGNPAKVVKYLNF
jgi:serine acetyltransferase